MSELVFSTPLYPDWMCNNPSLSCRSLVTQNKMIEWGFLWQSLRRSHEARLYIDEANLLKELVESVENITDVVKILPIEDILFPVKARKHLSPKRCKALADKILKDLAETSDNWQEELITLHLLTKGGSLGGRMRNIIGMEGSRQFVEIIFTSLKQKNIELEDVIYGKDKVKEIRWAHKTLLFDKNIPFIGKNVDCI